MYNQGLFRDWVPKLVQLLLILIFTIVIVPVNGVYVGNVSYMVGSTGIQTEYFVWANYAGVIGMGAAMPIILRMKMPVQDPRQSNIYLYSDRYFELCKWNDRSSLFNGRQLIDHRIFKNYHFAGVYYSDHDDDRTRRKQREVLFCFLSVLHYHFADRRICFNNVSV